MKEYQLQKAVCKYLDFRRVLYCGSMGGQYQVYYSQRLKSRETGYKAGFPDLFIYEPRANYSGLAIELKIGKNKATKSQKRWISELNKRGYMAKVCTGIDEALDVINQYLKLN